jgi:hypothetical protein
MRLLPGASELAMGYAPVACTSFHSLWELAVTELSFSLLTASPLRCGLWVRPRKPHSATIPLPGIWGFLSPFGCGLEVANPRQGQARFDEGTESQQATVQICGLGRPLSPLQPRLPAGHRSVRDRGQGQDHVRIRLCRRASAHSQ